MEIVWSFDYVPDPPKNDDDAVEPALQENVNKSELLGVKLEI